METVDVQELAGRFNLPFKSNIVDEDVDVSFLEKLPLHFVKENLVFPLSKEDGRLTVAMVSPDAFNAVRDVGRLFGMETSPLLVPREAVMDAIHRYYERLSGSAEQVVAEIEGEESLEILAHEWEEPKDLLELTDEAPIIKLLNSLLFQAVKEKASDIHIEPYERNVSVRFRKDGILYSILSPPKIVQEALISRVKILANLDIAEKRLPQDGRIRLLVAGKDVDVRVSIVPTSFGERVVMRLLDRKGGLVDLTEAGLSVPLVRILREILAHNSGIVLVTGPTGSGKTTTLYASLNAINSEERNIITVEDPVEYQIKGIGQIQVNPKIDLDFATGLRSILRQDPDVIMIGEIRDVDTANIAIQASLTGHLVLSTLHTNDAPSAVSRLVDMGIETFLLSTSLSAVIAQRLVRVLCTNCKEPYEPSKEERALFTR
ncbi:MAG: Flp pilus assembly complex ATPase component TadA, partial [Proteobacteria bacterium]|nr:Flp pilus assembly complex ATPase component TadA [Pseudomonadota bacterium]